MFQSKIIMNRPINSSASFSFASKVKDYFLLIKFTLSFTVVFSCVICYLLAPNIVNFDITMIILLFIAGLLITGSANAINQAAEKDTDALMKSLFDSAYGYVVFPNIGKGAIGVGGASGNGIVYEKGTMIGKASMKQVTIGFQFGGQAYREVIFFENKETLDRFREDKIEFSAEASAVAATVGASANVKYTNGVMIFTQLKGGLMYEASVGGQKFNYTAF